MTLTDDINIAQNRLNEAVRHLTGSPDMFKSPAYNGMYQGHKIKLRYSKYLKVCNERVRVAKKKLRTLERKFCDKQKRKRR